MQSSNSASGNVSKGSENVNLKRYLFKDIFLKNITCTLMFIAALFRIAKTWKQLNWLLVGEWIKK